MDPNLERKRPWAPAPSPTGSRGFSLIDLSLFTGTFLGGRGLWSCREFFVFKCPQEIPTGFSETTPSSLWYPKLYLTEASHLGTSWAAARTHLQPLPGQPLEDTRVRGNLHCLPQLGAHPCPRAGFLACCGCPGRVLRPERRVEAVLRKTSGPLVSRLAGVWEALRGHGSLASSATLPILTHFTLRSTDRRRTRAHWAFAASANVYFSYFHATQSWQAALCPGRLSCKPHSALQPRVQQGTEVSPASGTPTLGTSQHQEGGELWLQCVSRGCKMPPVCVLRQFLGQVTAQAASTGVNSPRGVCEQRTPRGPQAPLFTSRSKGLHSQGKTPPATLDSPSALGRAGPVLLP